MQEREAEGELTSASVLDGSAALLKRRDDHLGQEDIAEALSYAAWRAEEVEVPLRQQ